MQEERGGHLLFRGIPSRSCFSRSNRVYSWRTIINNAVHIRAETAHFIKELELHSNRKLNYPDWIAQLVEVTRQSESLELFEKVIFQAKFLAKSFRVMKRIGSEGEGYDKLSAEFQAGLERVAKLLKQLLDSAPPEISRSFVSTFLSLRQESLSQLMGFLDDLSAVKNWRIDGKSLP